MARKEQALPRCDTSETMCYDPPRPSRHRSPHFNPTEKVRTLKNTYFSISATLEQLLSRMHEYAQMTLPSEFEDMRPDAKEPLQIWPGDGLAWSGTFYAVSTVEDDVPFFEMAVQEVDGTCRVRIRCLDPKAAKWVRDMIVWLAPGRASGSVQPLPDLPARSTAPEPPVAASMETNLPSLQPSSHNEPGQLPEPPQTPPPSPDRGASEASHLGQRQSSRRVQETPGRGIPQSAGLYESSRVLPGQAVQTEDSPELEALRTRRSTGLYSEFLPLTATYCPPIAAAYTASWS